MTGCVVVLALCVVGVGFIWLLSELRVIRHGQEALMHVKLPEKQRVTELPWWTATFREHGKLKKYRVQGKSEVDVVKTLYSQGHRDTLVSLEEEK